MSEATFRNRFKMQEERKALVEILKKNRDLRTKRKTIALKLCVMSSV